MGRDSASRAANTLVDRALGVELRGEVRAYKKKYAPLQKESQLPLR